MAGGAYCRNVVSSNGQSTTNVRATLMKDTTHICITTRLQVVDDLASEDRGCSGALRRTTPHMPEGSAYVVIFSLILPSST